MSVLEITRHERGKFGLDENEQLACDMIETQMHSGDVFADCVSAIEHMLMMKPSYKPTREHFEVIFAALRMIAEDDIDGAAIVLLLNLEDEFIYIADIIRNYICMTQY